MSDQDDGWVKVSDRLPPSAKAVLVYNGREVLEAWPEYDDKYPLVWYTGDYFHVHNVTHWRPLPPGPKD